MRNESQLLLLVDTLRKSPDETEWIEFKVNDKRPDGIGEYLSALANAATLMGKENRLSSLGRSRRHA